jgi:hypothetical protein
VGDSDIRYPAIRQVLGVLRKLPLLDYLDVDDDEIILKAAPFGYDHGHAARAGGYWLSVEFECMCESPPENANTVGSERAMMRVPYDDTFLYALNFEDALGKFRLGSGSSRAHTSQLRV